MSDRDEIVVLSATRTPQGRISGQLASLTAVQLGAVAVRAALERSGLGPEAVDAVVMGQVLQAGAGQNPARQTAIAAGIGWDVPTVTVNKVCLSGLAAIIEASRMIRLGDADVVVAGGQESMTNAPYLLPGARNGWKFGSVAALDHTDHDGLTDAFDQESMGSSTERHNKGLQLTREAQDEVAARSHQRAAAAWESGAFDDEIAEVSVPQRKGDPIVIRTDEGIRPDTTVETLARLRPAFSPDGTITAGNSSQLTDGAAAVVLTTRANAEAKGLTWLATLGAYGQVAGPDNSLHAQPSQAIKAALARAGWTADELDVIEINEAFAAVAVQSMLELGVSSDKVNLHGGAISLGHPIGASGARLVVHAAHELARRGGGRAAVALCGGGGQGDALLLHR
ncbi:acetyl-CoA C-acetyltransferase [Cellulomonas fimi]|uniref:Probable acetyl-CoA acetyltransferase n=1 Tax=Cellulomonas fimi TaxID=1708 RepID=A0A7Y0QHF6_CELFI|nr:acetyl-CoA C-acetyltransferase [Cellulomonas fimi]NMR19127.1 acetyl-CoA C-acetyltransferase [Cellulomonas fimi]